MALNLNKGNEENSKPNLEKKGLNLTKSGDSNPVNLNKEASEIESGDTTSLQENQYVEKKKSPVVYIVAAAILLGIGIFWFMNQNNNNTDVISTAATTNNTNDTAISQLVQEATTSSLETPVNTTENVNAETSVKPDEVQPKSSSNVNIPSTKKSNTTANPETSSNAIPSSDLVSKLVGSIEEKAKRVIRGDFGNGTERRKSLGSEYAEIQLRVNELLK